MHVQMYVHLYVLLCVYVFMYLYCICTNITHYHHTHYHYITTPDTNNTDRDLESVLGKSASVRIWKMVIRA